MTDRPEGAVCRQRIPDPGLKRALADEEAFASFLPAKPLGTVCAFMGVVGTLSTEGPRGRLGG